MREFTELPVFGVFITIGVYFLSLQLYKRHKVLVLNPVLVSTVSIIIFLKAFNISFESYNKGGQLLSFFLGPSVVALGVFMYERFEEVKKHLWPFFMAVITGGALSMVSVTMILLAYKVPKLLILSLLPKSVTTPIAIEIIGITGGYMEITAGIVIMTGILGNAFGPAFLKFTGIKSLPALGAALGAASHGIGTARALEEGKLAGVYSGLAMCLNGVFTALTAPFLANLIS